MKTKTKPAANAPAKPQQIKASVFLSPKDHERAFTRAKRAGVSLSAWIAELVTAKLKKAA